MELDLFDAWAAHHNFAVSFRERLTGEVRRISHKRSSQISSREDFTQKARSPDPMARDTPALDRGYVRSAARSLRE